MTILETTQPTTEQKYVIYRLWNNEYPAKISFKTFADLDNYLDGLSSINYYFLKNELDEIEGWAMTFIRENEKWFAIMIDDTAQGRGKGTFLLDKLKENEEILNGWVIDHDNDTRQNGEIYKSPLQFYQKNDFLISPGTRLEIPALSAVKITWTKNKNLPCQ